jgi:hypothetical protein
MQSKELVLPKRSVYIRMVMALRMIVLPKTTYCQPLQSVPQNIKIPNPGILTELEIKEI